MVDRHRLRGGPGDAEGHREGAVSTKKQTPRAAFRAELKRLLPGLKFTIARTRGRGGETSQEADDRFMCATASACVGHNRTFTMIVDRCGGDRPHYTVAVAGYSKNAPWLADVAGPTLRSALSIIEVACESRARSYGEMVEHIRKGRTRGEEEAAGEP